MVRAVAEFLVGAVAIVTPQYQLPLLAGSAAFKLGTALAKRSKRKRAPQESVPQNGDDKSDHLSLEWSQLSVAITNKKTGKRQQIFKDLQGIAQPGR